jgi:hypothetical protein
VTVSHHHFDESVVKGAGKGAGEGAGTGTGTGTGVGAGKGSGSGELGHGDAHSHSRVGSESHAHSHADSADAHAHSHTNSEPTSYGPSREGSVVVDIGGNVGALIIDTPPALVGAEIEISPEGSAQRTHVAVRERRGDGPVQHAAVFPALAAGSYTVWDPQGGERSTAVIAGASVTRITW